MAKKQKKKKGKKIYRDWNAVSARFRKAGPMKDHKKEDNRKKCRKEINNVDD